MNVEVFFDYACPYCYRGHQGLIELTKTYPDLEIVWRPCEAHPRPEPASVHSDLAIQGMYFIRDNHGDLLRYHELMYRAVFDQGRDISDPVVLSACAARCGADADAFQKALLENRYQRDVLEGNIYAWEKMRLRAVPSYASQNRLLGSRDGILVSRQKLEDFLKSLQS